MASPKTTEVKTATPKMAGPGRSNGRRAGASSARRAEAVAGLVLASPALIIFTVFMFVPLALTVWYSLHRYSGFGRLRWRGLENYQALLTDATFWRVLVNTLGYTAISVPLGMGLGLCAAVLLNRVMPGRTLYRALIYVPVVVSGVAVGIIFLRLFDPLLGIINQVLASAGLPTPDWQGSGAAAFLSIVIVSTWQGIGFSMVVYLAALQGVPSEIYEAAAVDGAVGWARFRQITFPLLAPTTVFLTVYSIILSFQVFDMVFVLTNGGPGNATTFLVQYAYETGFSQRRQGYAATIGISIYVIVLALTAVWWRLSNSKDEK